MIVSIRNVTRFSPLLALLLLLGCENAADPQNQSTQSGTKPNVLLVTLDTTRADRLGCYGHTSAQTPTLDALAAEGTRFEQALCHVPLTLPSHATLLVSAHPPTTGLHVNAAGRLPTTLPTLAEQFKQRDYRTAAFVAAWVLDGAFGLDRGFDHYDDSVGDADAQERPADAVVDAALSWLNANPDGPFFAWVHFFDPHFPYEPPQEHAVGDPYDGEIAFVDAQLARLLAAIEARGERDGTLVVIVGDHGEAFDEHGEVEHGVFLYDTTLRVPLIFAGAGVPQPGLVCPDAVGIVDVAPTIVELLGMERPDAWQGRSLLPALHGGKLEPRPIYAESDYPLTAFGWSPLRALILENWKYIAAPRPELYDRLADPLEEQDSTDTHPDIAKRLADELAAFTAALPVGNPDDAITGSDISQRLSSLGYLGGAGGAATTQPDPNRRDPKDMTHVVRDGRRAQLLIGAGRFAEVVQLVEPLVAASPESDELHGLLGRAYLKLGRMKPAETALRNSLRTVPTLSQNLLYLGDALYGQQRVADALAAYQDALAALPDYALAHNRLGAVYLRRSQWSLAETHLRRCVELNSDSPNALVNYAGVLLRTQRVDKAIAQLRQALTVDPKYAPAHQTLCRTLLDQRRFAEAEPALRAASAALPDDLRLKSQLAQVLIAGPSAPPTAVQEALALAQACVQAESQRIQYHEVLAMCYVAAGDRGQAAEVIRRALRLAQQQGDQSAVQRLSTRLRSYESGF